MISSVLRRIYHMFTIFDFMKFCLLCLREKAFLTVMIIKVFENVANVTAIRRCSQSSTECIFIDILLILIVQECFTVEELNSLLYMIFTYRKWRQSYCPPTLPPGSAVPVYLFTITLYSPYKYIVELKTTNSKKWLPQV